MLSGRTLADRITETGGNYSSPLQGKSISTNSNYLVFSSFTLSSKVKTKTIFFLSNFLGTKVVVSNLQPTVTQEDIMELFGDVGPLKRAKVAVPGTAEVVYVNMNDALKAVEVYHNRQLDGRSMKCQIVGVSMTSM
jgi:RNA recognition motif-containing protein